MKQGLLVIGGGILQIWSLKKARELNLTTYLTDGSKDCFARKYADFFYQIDTKDIEGNANLALMLRKKGKISGVYTQGTDVEYTVAYAATKSGLFSIKPKTALNCNDKYLTRLMLSKEGIDNTKFAKVETLAELRKAIKKVGLPCFVKPADNSASRGVFRIRSLVNLDSIFKKSISSCSLARHLIVESEIKGEEFSIDTVLYKGKLYPAGISDRMFLKKSKFAVQAASRTPSMLPESKQEEMYNLMARAAKALGVDNGAFKGDLALDRDNKVRVIELTARTSGGFDSQLRKPLSFGIDLIKATMDIALGKPLDPTDLIPKWIKWSSTVSIFPRPGKVKKITGTSDLLKIKGVSEIIMLVKSGDIIKPYTDNAKRTNYIICKADTLEELKLVEKKALKTLKIETEK